jgi:thiamine-phosphate pyrophosphorylase
VILCYVTDRKSLIPDHPPSAAASPLAPSVLPGNSFTPLLLHVAAAASAGVDWIQVREKDLAAKDCAALAAATRAQCRATRAKVLVNDRLDVALAESAHGVHLGERSLPVAQVCSCLRASSPLTRYTPFLVGASCHSVASAIAAAQAGAGYIFFGPVFDSPSKRAFGPAQGVSLLAQVCRAISTPVLAIGGITAENTSMCINAGAAGIAAIRLFQESVDLSAVVSQLRSAG